MSIHRNPEAERRIQDRIETRLAAGQEKLLRRALSAGYRDAADAHESGRSVEAAIAEHNNRIERAIIDMYSSAFETIGERTAKQIDEATGKGWRRMDSKVDDDRFQRGLRAFIERWAGRKITQISSTTAEAIRRVIKNGNEDGKTLEEISSEIIQTGARNSMYRAHLIARTEVHSAGQAGGLFAAQQSDVVRLKEWIDVGDSRTRDGDNTDFDHTNVASVPVGDPFIVSGEQLMHPGDPSGSAGNVIMCRCAMTYTTR